MSNVLYFGQVTYLYDDYGNLIVNHETGGLWLWQIYDESLSINKLVIEWHLGDGSYEQLTQFV